MELTIKFSDKGLRYFVAIAFIALITYALIGFLANALTPEGFAELQNFGPVK